jgi:hypothetical protein
MAKEKRRELVDQGLVVDHLVAQAYEELQRGRFPLRNRRSRAPGERARPVPAAATRTPTIENFDCL